MTWVKLELLVLRFHVCFSPELDELDLGLDFPEQCLLPKLFFTIPIISFQDEDYQKIHFVFVLNLTLDS